MDTALPQKIPFILDRNLANANCTEDRVCTSCDTVVLAIDIKHKVRVALTFAPNCRAWGWGRRERRS